MKRTFRGGLWVIGFLSAGCTGILNGESVEEGSSSDRNDGVAAGGADPAPSLDDPDQAPTQFSCDPELVNPSPGMRRLTHRQYENTLADLIAIRLGEERAASILRDAAPALSRIPDDERAGFPQDLHGTFRRLDQSVQQSHVDSWYESGVLLGALLSAPDNLSDLLGDCAGDADAANDDACVRDFVRSFGDLVFRRPMSDEEFAHALSFYAPSTGIDSLGVADVIGGLLNAPQFLYLIEHGEAEMPDQANTFGLSSYELASRLSYHFWGTMPDARLRELAASGELHEDESYRAEVLRLFEDERTHATLREFFLEWMKLEDLKELDANNASAIYQNFAGENLPSPGLRGAMMDEVVDMLDYFTWRAPGGIEQLFTSSLAFPRSAELADIYGVSQWDGESVPPQLSAARPGILTRAAFLTTGTANTRPIMKGLFIRRNILCDKIPPPPENVSAIPPDLDAELSTRDVVSALTDVPGCSGCHSVYMNPLGFTTEGFDSLGRERVAQQLFDEVGEPTGLAELDTSSVPQVLLGDMTQSSGPDDLMTLIADSGKASACAVRHYFRFTFGRFEGVVSDGCVLEQMRIALDDTGGLAGMLESVALSDAFRRRTFNFGPATAAGSN